MRVDRICYLIVFLVFFVAADAQAQVQERRAVPARPIVKSGYVLEKMALEARIDGQKASCSLTYVIYNPGDSPLEVDFLAPLPEGGTVTGLTLLDGQKET